MHDNVLTPLSPTPEPTSDLSLIQPKIIIFSLVCLNFQMFLKFKRYYVKKKKKPYSTNRSNITFALSLALASCVLCLLYELELSHLHYFKCPVHVTPAFIKGSKVAIKQT